MSEAATETVAEHHKRKMEDALLKAHPTSYSAAHIRLSRWLAGVEQRAEGLGRVVDDETSVAGGWDGTGTYTHIRAGDLRALLSQKVIVVESEHRPTAMVQVDVFTDSADLSHIETPTEEDVANAAWNDITRWVEEGYQPMVVVMMPGGVNHDVDLEEVNRVDEPEGMDRA